MLNQTVFFCAVQKPPAGQTARMPTERDGRCYHAYNVCLHVITSDTIYLCTQLGLMIFILNLALINDIYRLKHLFVSNLSTAEFNSFQLELDTCKYSCICFKLLRDIVTIFEMKFTVSSVAKSTARLGSLSEFTRIPEAVLETPLLLLHTRGASVPHLSYDLLQMVSTESQILQMPLVTLVDHTKNVKAFGKGIAEFAGLKEYLNYVSVQDSGTTTPEGYHEKNSVSLWTRGGRKLIDPQNYITCIEALKPDMFQAMVDGDTTSNSSVKRVRRSVDDTVKFAGICANLKEKSEVLKDTPMLACITGGYNIKERLRCITELKGLDVAGYVLEGFHTNGESATNLIWEDLEPVLTETIESLPDNLPRAFHGPVTPIILLKLVSKGIDIFDATFPWLVAERAGALVFPNTLLKGNAPITETLPSVKSQALITPKEKDGSLENENSKDELVDRVFEINIKDKLYFNDTRPLVEDCSCYCCRKYSRSYIHHLSTTSELQGPILLMMHNLHHYINFFRSIRLAIREDQLQGLHSTLEQFVTSRRS